MSANQKGCCCCSGTSDCCAPKEQGEKRIIIDFLYLDLSVCTRCQGTDSVLEEAVAEVSQVLGAAGYDVIVNKININTRALAVKHRFVSSPTIRVDGRDIDTDIKETLCESCGDLCGDSVDCRVWTYQGKEYTVPPKAMIVDALLRAAYSPKEPIGNDEYNLPPNLARFFDAMENKKEG